VIGKSYNLLRRGTETLGMTEPRFAKEIAAIAFPTASFQTSRLKPREVPRSALKPQSGEKQ
jgi:hypothetical protein